MNAKDLKFFDEMASAWDSICEVDPVKISHILDVAGVGMGESVLDVGSGTGVLIPFLEERIGDEGKMCAADMSGEMLKVSKSKHSHFANLSFMQVDIEEDSLPDHYDRILLYCVYPHLVNAEETVQWLAKVNLAPGGSLTIAFPQSKEGINCIHHHNDGSVHSTHLIDGQELKMRFQSLGLNVDYVEDNDEYYIIRIKKEVIECPQKGGAQQSPSCGKLSLILVLFALLPLWGWACKQDSIVMAVQALMERYPESTLLDIYKSAFQNRFGPGHIISDLNHAKEYLDWELQQPALYNNPPFEPTIYDGQYVRVNLSVLTDSIVPYEAFFDAFIESANQVQQPTIEAWKIEWQEILQAVESLSLDLPGMADDEAAIEERLEQGIYMGSHSEAYAKAYDPHYRIMRRDVFEEKIMPYLSPLSNQ